MLHKTQKEALIFKVVEFVKDLTEQEIYEVLSGARDKLVEIRNQAREKKLVDLFASQITTLSERGCPKAILSVLQGQMGPVIARAKQMTFKEGRIPFLPVIPALFLSIYTQMEMVKNKTKSGRNLLDPTDLTNVVQTPKKPYFIFDVEDGTEMRGRSIADAEDLISKQRNRRCLTDVESISLCIHTDVLNRHNVDCSGSLCGPDYAPGLFLDEDGSRLGRSSFYAYSDGWGSASCSRKK